MTTHRTVFCVDFELIDVSGKGNCVNKYKTRLRSDTSADTV
jgi:hypothetical protein